MVTINKEEQKEAMEERECWSAQKHIKDCKMYCRNKNFGY